MGDRQWAVNHCGDPAYPQSGPGRSGVDAGLASGAAFCLCTSLHSGAAHPLSVELGMVYFGRRGASDWHTDTDFGALVGAASHGRCVSLADRPSGLRRGGNGSQCNRIGRICTGAIWSRGG